jgi:N-acetylneuraminate synthase
MSKFSISGRIIGPNDPPYIIAELSANHNGSIIRAKQSIKTAKDCGANAVKLQTYTPDTMTLKSDKNDFLLHGGLWDGYRLYDLYEDAHTPYEWHEELFTYAKEIGITLFSTPFDESSVDLLESLNTPAYKIASFELTDLPLISYAAKKRKPMLMSTGMASESEICEAIETAYSNGCPSVLLFHCISSYPTPIEHANLKKIVNLQKTFNVPVGLSDHTVDNTASIVAVALGACAIEKHFTINREEKGPDSEFSIEPDELQSLVENAFSAWKSLGSSSFIRPKIESKNLIFKRSIYFVNDLKAGEKIKPSDIRRIRPGFGLPPKYFDDLIGKIVLKDVQRGDATSRENIKGI